MRKELTRRACFDHYFSRGKISPDCCTNRRDFSVQILEEPSLTTTYILSIQPQIQKSAQETPFNIKLLCQKCL